MATLVLGTGIFILAMLGLALGVFFGRGPVKGSCGGLACGACATCPHAKEKANRHE